MKIAFVNAALIGVGGFLGALCRYGVGSLLQKSAQLAYFPYGTLAANLLGCFLIGAVMGLMETRQVFGPEFRLFVVIGLLGGFTTYSAFGYESFLLLRDAAYLRAAANVLLHVFLGLGLVWFGHWLTAR